MSVKLKYEQIRAKEREVHDMREGPSQRVSGGAKGLGQEREAGKDW